MTRTPALVSTARIIRLLEAGCQAAVGQQSGIINRELDGNREASVKRSNLDLLFVVSVLFFLAACAHVTPPGSQIAVLHVAECME